MRWDTYLPLSCWYFPRGKISVSLFLFIISLSRSISIAAGLRKRGRRTENPCPSEIPSAVERRGSLKTSLSKRSRPENVESELWGGFSTGPSRRELLKGSRRDPVENPASRCAESLEGCAMCVIQNIRVSEPFPLRGVYHDVPVLSRSSRWGRIAQAGGIN